MRKMVKKNYAILKNHSLTKDKINIDKIFCDSEIYTVVGYIHLNKNNYIEYEVYKPFRNMGFATEMLTAIKNYCLSQKVSPNLYINSLNDKSKNTAKKVVLFMKNHTIKYQIVKNGE